MLEEQSGFFTPRADISPKERWVPYIVKPELRRATPDFGPNSKMKYWTRRGTTEGAFLDPVGNSHAQADDIRQDLKPLFRAVANKETNLKAAEAVDDNAECVSDDKAW